MPFELHAGVDHVDGLLDGSDQQVLVRLVAQVAGVDQGGVPGMFGRKFNLRKKVHNRRNKINVNLVGFLEIRFSKYLKSSCWKKREQTDPRLRGLKRTGSMETACRDVGE